MHVWQMPEGSAILRDSYKKLDPCNRFDPCVGQTTKLAHWKEGQKARQVAEQQAEAVAKLKPRIIFQPT